MKVSAVKPAVRTKGRWNVFLDGSYSFSLSDEQLIETKLKLGDEIDGQRELELKLESDFGKKYARALELIMRRVRSVKEIHDYGRRKKWEPEETERILKKLIAKGYVDDEKFAAAWVRSRAALKHASLRKLKLELRQKGISSEIIDRIIEQSEDYNEQRTLAQLVDKKRARYPDQTKLIAYLMRQGFRYGDVKAALEETKGT